MGSCFTHGRHGLAHARYATRRRNRLRPLARDLVAPSERVAQAPPGQQGDYRLAPSKLFALLTARSSHLGPIAYVRVLIIDRYDPEIAKATHR
jgi:hypothetical protein